MKVGRIFGRGGWGSAILVELWGCFALLLQELPDLLRVLGTGCSVWRDVIARGDG